MLQQWQTGWTDWPLPIRREQRAALRRVCVGIVVVSFFNASPLLTLTRGEVNTNDSPAPLAPSLSSQQQFSLVNHTDAP